MKSRGFTLLEMLMVLVIVGILTALVSTVFLKSAKTRRVEESAQQFASILQNAREGSVRFNKDASVVVSADGKTLTSKINGTTSTATLPNGVALTPVNVTVTYSAPYSILSTKAVKFAVANAQGVTRYIRTVGTLGEVIVSAE